MKVMTINANVIEELFNGTNFGGSEQTDAARRGLMVECVLKRACGYHDGSTIVGICKDAGLLTNSGNSTKAGLRWAFDQIYRSSLKTIVERMEQHRPDTEQDTACNA